MVLHLHQAGTKRFRLWHKFMMVFFAFLFFVGILNSGCGHAVSSQRTHAPDLVYASSVLGAPSAPSSALRVSTPVLEHRGEFAEVHEQTLKGSPCPPDMVHIAHYCIDKYEASLVYQSGEFAGEPFPYYKNPEDMDVKAVSLGGRKPQGYMSREQAVDACAASGKRLCTLSEWKQACKGASQTTYPYGSSHQDKACNDHGVSPLGVVFPIEAMTLAKRSAQYAPAKGYVVSHQVENRGKIHSSHQKKKKDGKSKSSSVHSGTSGTAHGKTSPKKKEHASGKSHAHAQTEASKARHAHANKIHPERRRSRGPGPGVSLYVWSKMNDERLLQVENALADSGAHGMCVSDYGVFDMVGNLHEWVSDDAGENGIFAGGYFLDTSINGEACEYSTRAHAPSYHDYSIGFRCCKDVEEEAL